jgi:DHA1 family bicyclomycin/chloramphenicol resistance-like MFS transporter
MNKRRHFLLVTILGLMVAVGPFSIDMYLPAFKVIANEMHTTISNVALSMASYFVGMAAGQLLYGPLLDRFGRKRPLFAGLVVYLAASLACILSTNVDQLITFRLLQALGGSAASVAAFAMVRDIFPVKENAKIFSSLMLVISASPIIAPSLGGFASIAWGWQSVFIILIVITILIIVLVFTALPESKGPDASFSLLPHHILRSFAEVFRDPQFTTYAVSGGIAFAGIFVFVSTSPFLYMKLYGLDEKEYGILFAVVVGAMIATSQVNRLLLLHYSTEKLIGWAISLQFLFGILMMTVALMNAETFYLQTGLIMLFLATIGIILPNSSALVLAPFSSNTGTASAMMGALQLSFGALASFLVSIMTTTSSMPMTVIMCISASSALVCLLIGRPFIKVIHAGEASPSSLH